MRICPSQQLTALIADVLHECPGLLEVCRGGLNKVIFPGGHIGAKEDEIQIVLLFHVIQDFEKGFPGLWEEEDT